MNVSSSRFHQDGSVQEIVGNLDVELKGKARGRKYSFGIIFIVERSEIEIWGEIEMSGLTKN